MSQDRAQLPPLTSMRFFLALWVVVFHQTGPYNYLAEWVPRLPALLFCLLRTGYLAVGFFFLLSGFVLAYNYSLESRWSRGYLIKFAVGRFSRIYPAYCLGLLLTAHFALRPLFERLSALSVVKQAIIAGLHWTLLQAWVPQFALNWNPPGWSLSVEAFFYVCFPWVGVALWRLSGLKSLVFAGCLIWAAALLAPIIAVQSPIAGFGDVQATLWDPPNFMWANFVKYNPLLSLPQFCAGIVLARAYCQLKQSNHWLLGRGYFLYVPGILFGGLAIAFANHLPYPLVHNGLLLPLNACTVMGLALGGGTFARILSARPLLFLGNASYAMYIMHVPISLWLNVAVEHVVGHKLAGLNIMFFYVGMVILLSSLVHIWFEEPANRILKRRLASRVASSREDEAERL